MKIRIVIVDDELLARVLIRELLSSDPEVTVVAECGNGQDAVAAVTSIEPHLVFLDVQMPGMSGLEVAASFGLAAPYVIFVTAYDRYAIEAFQMQALDYLLKPFSKERFRESLERAKESIRKRELVGVAKKMWSLARSYSELQASFESIEGSAPSYTSELRVSTGRRPTILDVSRIAWIEAANQYVRLHTLERSYLLSRSLARLEKELDPKHFCRIHRSTIVNTAFVEEVRPEKNGARSVLMAGGQRLRMSRRRRSVLGEQIERR